MQAVLYVPGEIAGEKTLIRYSQENDNWFSLSEPVTEQSFRADLDKLEKEYQIYAKDCLLIGAKDATLQLANKCQIATVAYLNPMIVGQSYPGTQLLAEGFEEIDEEYLTRMYKRYHGIPWEMIQTKRCVIRELSLDDLSELFELYEKPGMTDYMEGLYPWKEEMEYQRAYIANMYRFFEYGMWLVFQKESGKLIGRAGLEHREYDNEMELEMGYAIAPEFQHQGYATEVCTAIMEYAKENLAYERLNCFIQKENDNSIRLVKRLGFTFWEETQVDGDTMLRYVYSFSQNADGD